MTKSNPYRFLLMAALALPACGLAGCKPMSYLLYVLAPAGPAKYVNAEYGKLGGHSVAIVVYAGQDALYEYPTVQLELASVIGGEIQRHIKGVSVIDPRRIIKYQNENLSWDAMDKTALGRQFGADYVLYVALVEFSTREPGTMNLYRGRLTAEASLFQTALPESSSRVWGTQTFTASYPLNAAIGVPGDSDEHVRYKTEQAFAQELVRKFYRHKLPSESS